MPEKDPNTWSVASLIVALGAAVGGGLIAYREEMKYAHHFSICSFLLDMATSAFVGFMAFWVCHDVLQQPDALCACAAGFAGNLGASIFDLGKHAIAARTGWGRSAFRKKEDGE